MSRLKMVLVGGLVATTAALTLVDDMALGQAGPQTQPAKPPGDRKRPEFPPFDDVVKGMTAIRSTPTDPKLYNLYYDTKKGKLLAEIPSSQLKKDFLLYTSIAGGGYYTGWQYDDVMVRWERRDKRLLLVKPEGTGNEILDRLCGHAQAVRAEVIAEEIKPPLDPPDEGLVGMLFQV